MLKKFNGFMSLSIGYAVLFALIGIVLVVFPKDSITVISYVISGALIISGTYLIIRYNDAKMLIDFVTIGVLSVLLGIIILLYPEALAVVIPIIIGVFIVIESVIKIKISLVLKDVQDDKWILTLMLAILEMLCGLIMIINPKVGALTLTTLLGILLLVYSASAMIDLVIFKKNVNNIVKYFK